MIDFSREIATDYYAWIDSEDGQRNIARFGDLVPDSGPARTERGEVLRMINRLVYDIFNNGLINDKRMEINFLLYTLEIDDDLKVILNKSDNFPLMAPLLRKFRDLVAQNWDRAASAYDDGTEYDNYSEYEITDKDWAVLKDLLNGIVENSYN